MSKLLIFFWVLVREVVLLRGDVWQADLTSAIKIGLSTSGYKSVELKCDPQHFAVNVTLEKDFQGIVYTRGSFSEKNLPCFKRHDQNSFRNNMELVIGLRIPFYECGTSMDASESHYKNTLVVQHDPDLIMPGDAAFSLDCVFAPERRVSAEFGVTESSFRSKITLVDADPSSENASPITQNVTAFSKSDKVTFVPNSRTTKDEL